MTCEEFEELSGAYVLDAITPAERQTAQAHLATCQKCTSLLRELREVVSLLSHTVPQVNPSPELKERILAAIREESQRTSGSMPRRPIPLTQVRRQRPSLRILIAAAVLIFALFSSLAAWNMSLQTQIAALQGQTTLSNVASYPLQGTVTGATGQLFYFAGQNFNVQNGSASLSFEGNVSGYDATVISLEQGPSGTPKIPPGSIVAIGALKHVANVKNNSTSFHLLLLPFKTDEQLSPTNKA